MSPPDRISRWAEIAGDRLNPILVKETRQALKSKQFMATFAMMLIGGWLVSAFVLLWLNVGYDDRPIGKEIFPWYYTLLALTVILVVPFGAFRSLLSERDLNTYELLSITTLSPRQIIWGKWLSSQVQTFIYFSAVSPFIAFTYLLRGVDFPSIAFVLVASMLLSMLFSLGSLTLSTFAKQRQAQVVLSLMLLGWLVLGLGYSIFFASWTVIEPWISWGEAEFLWGLAILCSYYVATFVLCLQIARAKLTFESDNRSSGIRLTCSAIFVLTLSWLGYGALHGMFSGMAGGGTIDDELLTVVIVFLAVFWAVVALFAATERDLLSRRNSSRLPGNPLFKFFLVPFLPGGGRGFLFIVAHWAVLSGLAFAAASFNTSSGWEPIGFLTFGLGCYIVIFSGLASAVGRWMRKGGHEFRPGHCRALIMVMFAIGWLTPNILTIFRDTSRAANPYFYITDPVSTLGQLSGGGVLGDGVLLILIAAASVMVLLNTKAMLRGITEVVLTPPAVTPQPTEGERQA